MFSTVTHAYFASYYGEMAEHLPKLAKKMIEKQGTVV